MAFYLRRDLRKHGVFRKAWTKLIPFAFWYFFSYMTLAHRILVRATSNSTTCTFALVAYYCCPLESLVFFTSWEAKERTHFCFTVKELHTKHVSPLWVSNRRTAYNSWALLPLFTKTPSARVKISSILISHLKMKEREMFFSCLTTIMLHIPLHWHICRLSPWLSNIKKASHFLLPYYLLSDTV